MELLARTCNTNRINIQRIFARLFVIVGAVFWGSAAWGAKWAYEGAPFTTSLSYALLYAGAILAVFVIGLFYENIAALLLAVGSIAIIIVGLVFSWEPGVWAVMGFFFILPLVIAAILYFMAADSQKKCPPDVAM